MRRRTTTVGKSIKARGRKRKTRERHIAPAVAHPNDPSAVDLQEELARSRRELNEALEQQTATSDVLRIISNSPGELQPVFESILANATRICAAKFGVLHLTEGDRFRTVSLHNAPPDYVEAKRRDPIVRSPPKTSALYRVRETRQVIQITDVREEAAYRDGGDASRANFVHLTGVRSLLAVPLLKDDALVGVIQIWRQEVRPFTAKQIELVQNFATQAVIAVENTRLLNELRQSLEQQTATSEVLRVISTSPGELEPVFQALLENATRICEANFGTLYLAEGEYYRAVAMHNAPTAFVEFQRRRGLFHPTPGAMLDRTTRMKKVSYSADAASDAVIGNSAKVGGARSVVYVPMLKDDVSVGAIVIYRQEVRPFTEKQIELLTNFASQAVIAIENTRLLNELRQRTTDLSESLAQQTATSKVLSVISSSPGELEPVFQSMLENATHICEANFGMLYRFDGKAFHFAAEVGSPSEYVEFNRRRGAFQPVTGGQLERVMLTKQVCHTADDAAGAVPGIAARLAGARTQVTVPMLKDSELIGVIIIYRQEVRPFTDKQIALVQNFAAQAVIAIENTRLLNELRESLQQQTATSNVLEVISRSAFDLHAVFGTVVESSVRLCGAHRAIIYRFDGELLRMTAAFNASQEFKEWIERNPIRPGRHTAAARAALERRMIHIPDILDDPDYTYGGRFIERIRTVLGVPILKGDELLGAMVIYHLEVRPFTDKQIALVETFADQAAIAIENVRLLDQLRQRTEELGRSVGELRALGEVSQTVNSTLDLETVLSTIVSKAVQLSETEAGAIYGYDEKAQEFRLRATYGMDQEMINTLARRHIGVDEPNIAPALARREPIQVADLKRGAATGLNEIILRAGYRALLVAPLLRGDEIVGVLAVRRRLPGQFAQNTIDLIKTFAAQSALAIQNARLFDSVETRTHELAKSLEDLRTAQDRLVQTEKLASLGQLTAGIAHEIKNPLNFVNNFSGLSVELIDELQETLGAVKVDGKTRTEIAELTDTLRGNLEKVVQHGKRADSIVKNMLLHSREGSGEHRPVDINAIVEESLNLAYHGARAEKEGFKITLERSLDPTAGEVDVFPQEITRVLLNLISNGFYAATKRKGLTNNDAYEPTVRAATKNLGDRVEIRIRDNGTGMLPEVKDKMFNPFFTTKPAGEGTGLGLSISHDIIAKQHAGSIEVDTEPGEFTEVKIILPRAAASLAKSV